MYENATCSTREQNIQTGQQFDRPAGEGVPATRAYILTGRVNKPEEIARRFTYHAPQPDQPFRYGYLRDQAKALADSIVRMTPESREQSLALTHLEEAVMWANAAIARNE